MSDENKEQLIPIVHGYYFKAINNPENIEPIIFGYQQSGSIILRRLMVSASPRSRLYMDTNMRVDF